MAVNIVSRESAEALIHDQLMTTVFQEAPKNSIVMQFGRKLPNMTSKQTRVPVLSMLPMAYWVGGDNIGGCSLSEYQFCLAGVMQCSGAMTLNLNVTNWSGNTVNGQQSAGLIFRAVKISG